MVAKNLEQIGPSSFGWENTTTYSPRTMLASERFQTLDRKLQYYECRQHDHKKYDFDGRVIASGTYGMRATQPLMGIESVPFYVPLKSRRPNAPYRLARVIVSSFTSLIFGDNRFPELLVLGDANAQDYVRTLAGVSGLPSKMIRARNLGGATGTACLSWSFVNGRPRVNVHNPQNVCVHEWEDREQLVPRCVTECYQYSVSEYDPVKKRYAQVPYWYRRDWTPDADVAFVPCPVIAGQDPFFQVDPDKSAQHNDGLCHFVWIQNIPCDDIDGDSDYEGLYESFDALDLLLSVIVRGGTLNLDPTLKLKMDPDLINRMGVRKGSDQAIIVGVDGDASYMEMAGTSIQAGLSLFAKKRDTVLEVAQCVIPDPDKIAAGNVSGVALKVVFATMLSKCDIIREQYGAGIRAILDPMLVIARKASKSTVVITDAEGMEREVRTEVQLPPRVDSKTKFDEMGNDTGEEIVELVPRDPGDGGVLELTWGEYFKPTPTDHSAIITALVSATGNRPFMSEQTATDIVAASFGRDGRDEWRKLSEQHAIAEAKQAEMFSDSAGSIVGGGQIQHTMKLPGGGSMRRKADIPAGFGLPEIESSQEMPVTSEKATLTSSDVATIITVNEARAAIDLPPLDTEDGKLTVAEYKARHAEPIAIAAAAASGETGGEE